MTAMTRIFMAAVLAGLASAAQAAAPAAGTKFDDWTVECETLPDEKGQQCFLSQGQALKENNLRVLKVSIGLVNGGKKVRLLAIFPLGIDLRAGAVVKIGTLEERRMEMQRCTQEGCLAAIEYDAKQLAAITAAKDVRLGIRPFGTDKTLVLNVSPNGLKKGLESLK